MKWQLIFLFPLMQCIPQKERYEKFVQIRKDNSNGNKKFFSCTVSPVGDDMDMSHYTVFGVSLKKNIEYGRLKVAFEKKGNRLNYSEVLRGDRDITLDKIYMPEGEKLKFQKGKRCRFRIFFDEEDNNPQFMLSNGELCFFDKNKGVDASEDEQIKISVCIEHMNGGEIHKTSDEIILS